MPLPAKPIVNSPYCNLKPLSTRAIQNISPRIKSPGMLKYEKDLLNDTYKK